MRDTQIILGHSRLAITLEICTHEDRQAQREARRGQRKAVGARRAAVLWRPASYERIQVGLPHVRKTAEVTIETDTYRITVGEGITITAPRPTSPDIKRHKASNYQPG